MFCKNFVSAAILAAVLIAPLSASADASGNPKAGKAVYENSCQICHGATGRGDGAAAAALNPKPMNFGDKVKMAKVTEAVMIKAITEGGAAVGASPNMAPFKETLSAQQIQDVAAYIRKTFVH